MRRVRRRPFRTRPRPTTLRFAGVLALLALAAIVIPLLACAASRSHPAASGSGQPRGVVRLLAGQRTVARISLSPLTVNGRLVTSRVGEAVRAALPRRVTVKAGRASLMIAPNAAGTTRRVLAAGPAGGAVSIAGTTVAATIATPVVEQALHNNCETAALSALLASAGTRVDQLELQRHVARSGPLDPETEHGHQVWGDPELGFVGRAAGGGVAGGFGVYQGPIKALAKHYGHGLVDLTGHQPRDLYARLLSGHAVMAWIGLSDGPYGTWQSPAGRHVRVNFGEHAVVLVGRHADGDVDVVNVLNGTRERWTPAGFEAAWALLGRRALAT